MQSVLKGACALGAVVIATAGVAVSAHATTAVSGGLNMVANASVNGGASASNNDNPSWAGVPANLSGFVSATSTNPVTGATATASGAANATWAGADSGTVTFTRYGWAVNTSTVGSADLLFNRGGDDWTYTFTATSNGAITVNYNVSLDSGNGFGLWGWRIDFNGVGSGGPAVNNALDPTASGVFTGDLVAGQTYTIGLNGNPNIGGALTTGFMNGEFDWTITNSVPEPGTWALMLLGVGLMGASLRSRRKLVTA